MILNADRADAGKRLDAFLHERLPEFSRSRLQSWVKEGRVRLGIDAVRAAYILKGGEEISVQPAALPSLRAEAEDLPLNIIYQDHDVVVVNKPSGMVVHAGAGQWGGTLVNALLHHFGMLSSVSGETRPGIVHRLDKETSGVLVVARTDQAHRKLAAQFEARQVEKVYLALAQGKFERPKGEITLPVTRDPVHRTRMSARLGSGRAAFTRYELLESFANCSLLEVQLGTGRTHQIRVHLAAIHHPIIGDRLYGGPGSFAGYPPLQRFFLHARRLCFRSPSTGELITAEAPLPAEFQELLEFLRGPADRMK